MKVHYPKLYNMAHLLSLNVFTASKGSNNYILFKKRLKNIDFCPVKFQFLLQKKMYVHVRVLVMSQNNFLLCICSYFNRVITFNNKQGLYSK